VAAIAALGCAQQAPALVSTLLAAMVQEHERAAGAWHSEWRPLCDLLTTTGSAAAWLRTSLEGLEVDPERMRANLGDDDLDTGAATHLVDRALEHR
jgi:3-carboxy-cis,cis-muconate cycloisomerase